jgi:integrase/recombinase XerC
MTLEDTDLRDRVFRCPNKGSRRKSLEVPFGPRTALALDRYLRLRSVHPFAYLPDFWLGLEGRFTDSGVRQVIARRGTAIGVSGLHPHQFRHSFADRWLRAENGKEGDLITLMGWTNGKQLDRYGAIGRKDRAIRAHRQLRLGDDL